MKNMYKLMLAAFLLITSGIAMNAQAQYCEDFGQTTSDNTRGMGSVDFTVLGVKTTVDTKVDGTAKIAAGNLYRGVFNESTPITVYRGKSITLLLKVDGGSFNWVHFAGYADWNNDKTFEKLFYDGNNANADRTQTITVPTDAAIGQTRIRVIMGWITQNTDVTAEAYYSSCQITGQPATATPKNARVYDFLVDVKNATEDLISPPTTTGTKGVILKGDHVTITSDAGTTMKYTTDDTDPATSATAVATESNTGTVTLNGNTTLKVIATKGATNSAVVTAAYKTLDVAFDKYYAAIFQREDASLALADQGDAANLKVATFVLNNETQSWKITKGSADGLYTLTSKSGNKIYYDATAARFKAAATPAADAQVDVRILASTNTTYPNSYEIQRVASTAAAMNMNNGAEVGNEIAEYTAGDSGNALKFIEMSIKTPLLNALTAAQTLADNTANAGEEIGQYSTAAKNALNEAIAAAQTVNADNSATEAQVNDATAALNAAIATFKNSVNMPKISTMGAAEYLYAIYTPNRENGTLADQGTGKRLISNNHATPPTVYPNNEVWALVDLGDGTYAIVNPFSNNNITVDASKNLMLTQTHLTAGGWKLAPANAAPLMLIYSIANSNAQLNNGSTTGGNVNNWGYNQTDWGGILNADKFVSNDAGSSYKIVKVAQRTEKAIPTNTPPAGNIVAGSNITINVANVTDVVYYTLDGTDPKTSETRAQLTLTATEDKNAPSSAVGTITAPANDFTLKYFVEGSQTNFASDVISVVYKITTSLNNASVENYVVRVQNRVIIVNGVENFDVFTVSGQKVNAKAALQNGVYIVKINNFTQKVIVK